jgi:beta-galactosidase
LLPLRVARVESLRPGHVEAGEIPVARWLEDIETTLEPEVRTASGAGLWYRHGRGHYLATWPHPQLLDRVLRRAAAEEGMEVLSLPDGLRLRRRGEVRFAVNYGPESVRLDSVLEGVGGFHFLLGGPVLAPAGVAAWREP